MDAVRAKEILELYWSDWWLENRRPCDDWQASAELEYITWVTEKHPELLNLPDEGDVPSRRRLQCMADELRRAQVIEGNEKRNSAAGA